jgi:hypothetical protein
MDLTHLGYLRVKTVDGKLAAHVDATLAGLNQLRTDQCPTRSMGTLYRFEGRSAVALAIALEVDTSVGTRHLNLPQRGLWIIRGWGLLCRLLRAQERRHL